MVSCIREIDSVLFVRSNGSIALLPIDEEEVAKLHGIIVSSGRMQRGTGPSGDFSVQR